MTIHSEPLPGVLVLKPKVFCDKRGVFVKTFHSVMFAGLGLPTAWAEEFHSVSNKGVIRGMHFQIPPCEHAKLVHCLRGRILDLVLDLRKSSPTFGKWAAVELTDVNRQLLYIPEGFAHGFLSLADDSLMNYKTTTVHSPAHDSGIRWDSFGFSWPFADPIISDRDMAFPEMADFITPFA